MSLSLVRLDLAFQALLARITKWRFFCFQFFWLSLARRLSHNQTYLRRWLTKALMSTINTHTAHTVVSDSHHHHLHRAPSNHLVSSRLPSPRLSYRVIRSVKSAKRIHCYRVGQEMINNTTPASLLPAGTRLLLHLPRQHRVIRHNVSQQRCQTARLLLL